MNPRLVLAAGVVLAGALVAVAFVAKPEADTAPAAGSTPPPPAAAHPGFPSPPAGAVVYSRQWGADALALGIVPGPRSTLVQASVLGPQGTGVSGLHVSLNGRLAEACGRGCYRLAFAKRPGSVELRVRTVTWRVLLAAPWPPRDATALVERADRAWRSLHSLTTNEYLASDAVHAAKSVWRTEAPDRLSYQVERGWAGIIVGAKRWDRAPDGARWVESPQAPVSQPRPPWFGVRDAHLLGTDVVAGRRVWRVSFFDPVTPAWFAIAIDQRTNRTVESQMITTAHFMHDRYTLFNRTSPVTPP